MAAEPVAINHLTEARNSAGQPRGKWGGRLAIALSAYHLAKQARESYTSWQNHRAYSIMLMEGDEVYGLVQEWLLANMPDGNQRALEARTLQHHEPAAEPAAPATLGTDPFAPVPAGYGDDEIVTRRVALRYNGDRVQQLDIDGHQVQVHVEREESSTIDGSGQYSYKPRKIIFSAESLAGRNAVVRLLQGIADKLVEGGKRSPRLIMGNRWGHWHGVRHLQNRTLDSVVLPAGHLDAITTDLRRFLTSEARYLELCVPWHRGYLFHGPPGTGKTSTARALASALGLDVYFIPLADLESNGTLNELVASVPERSVLLLEDIDVAHAATSRDDERQGLTLDGLLNVLDGVATPHGLVVVMTTNDRSALDEALVRPGRVDHEVEMTFLVPEQLDRLVQQLTGVEYGGSLADPWPEITAAAVVGKVTEHMYDPLAAVAAIDSMVAEAAKALALFQ